MPPPKTMMLFIYASNERINGNVKGSGLSVMQRTHSPGTKTQGLAEIGM
jgi:hypothetical protein